MFYQQQIPNVQNIPQVGTQFDFHLISAVDRFWVTLLPKSEMFDCIAINCDATCENMKYLRSVFLYSEHVCRECMVPVAYEFSQLENIQRKHKV